MGGGGGGGSLGAQANVLAYADVTFSIPESDGLSCYVTVPSSYHGYSLCMKLP